MAEMPTALKRRKTKKMQSASRAYNTMTDTTFKSDASLLPNSFHSKFATEMKIYRDAIRCSHYGSKSKHSI